MPKVDGIVLKIPQIRVLRAIARLGVVVRTELAEAAGFSPLSGSATRALHGLREGSSSGAAHPGLLELGLVREEWLDLDGVKEQVIAVTDAGRAWLAAHEGAELPKPRCKAASVNARYRG